MAERPQPVPRKAAISAALARISEATEAEIAGRNLAVPQAVSSPISRTQPLTHNLALHLKNNPKAFSEFVIMFSNLYNDMTPEIANHTINHYMQQMYMLQTRQSLTKFNAYQPDDAKMNINEVIDKMIDQKKRKRDIFEPEEKKD